MLFTISKRVFNFLRVMKIKKLALFGGTFDPIHLGHTTVAAEAADRIGCDEVIFIPTKRSPLKIILPRASDEDRLNMISLAITGSEKFKVSDYELRKTPPCYTIETVRYFRSQYGSDTEIYWLAGSDIVDEMLYWYKIPELIDECNIAILSRPQRKEPDFSPLQVSLGKKRVSKLERNIVKTSLVDISSTEVRNRLSEGRDVSEMLDPNVARYIYERNLYDAKKPNN